MQQEPELTDKERLDWLDQNIFNRENLTWDDKIHPTHNMWVMFSPRGAHGGARELIDAAIAADLR